MKKTLIFFLIILGGFLLFNEVKAQISNDGNLNKTYRSNTILNIDYGSGDSRRTLKIYGDLTNDIKNPQSYTGWKFYISPLLLPALNSDGTIKIEKSETFGSRYKCSIKIDMINQKVKAMAKLALDNHYKKTNPNVNISEQNITFAEIFFFTINNAGDADEYLASLEYKKDYIISDNSIDLFFTFTDEDDRDSFVTHLKDVVLSGSYLEPTAILQSSDCEIRFSNFSNTEFANQLNGIGGTMYVTRNDLKSIISRSINDMQIKCVRDYGSANSLSDEIITTLISSNINNFKTRNLTFDQLASQPTYNKEDLNPDKLTVELNETFTHDQDKDAWTFNKEVAKSGSAGISTPKIGLSGSGAKSTRLSRSDVSEILNQQGITHEWEGNKIKPKSLNVYEVGNSILQQDDVIKSINNTVNYKGQTVKFEIRFNNLIDIGAEELKELEDFLKRNQRPELPIGTVVYSILPPNKFAKETVGEWVLLEGQAYQENWKLKDIAGASTNTRLPNAKTQFIRSWGESKRSVGSLQTWTTAKPRSPFKVTGKTTTDGKHKHLLRYRKRYDYNAHGYGLHGWGGIFAMNWNSDAMTKEDGKPKQYSFTDGGHNHDISGEVKTGGDTETRPDNLSLYMYIRVN